MAYAYCDKHATLHIVEKMTTALNNRGQGKIIETDFPHLHGYPIVDGKSVFIYLDKGEAYIGGNTPENGGEVYDLEKDFALAEIVRKVKEESEV